jgi:hypothetical protein
MKHWSAAEVAMLRRIRQRFLDGTAGEADYWTSAEELRLYDATFAERIGWKWDAVLRELGAREWRPKSRHLLDWGCGSGVAHRRVLSEWPGFTSLALHDRSAAAVDFAARRAAEEFSGLLVELGEKLQPGTLLVVSHVLNELSGRDREHLLEIAQQAEEILWVEAGTHADSRRLIEVREALRGRFQVVAPCTHSTQCGLLTPENARHWCHHFASPPAAAFQDARWAELGRELEIDLRSLPYSFLVLSRLAGEQRPGFSRVIGTPREAKGYSRVLSCSQACVEDLMLQKRDAPDLLRRVQKGRELPIYRWKMAGGKIVGSSEADE